MAGPIPCRWLLLLALWLALTATAFAHRDDYLDETLVYETLERHEIEPEYWIDFGHSRSPGIFLRHHLALEYGISGRWMVDGRATAIQAPGGARFDSARLETRYRFREEGKLPVDIAVSGELNTSRDELGARRYAFEPRLILSKDFREKWNLTLNLAEEIALSGGERSFNPAFGVRYNARRKVSLGSELKYDTDAQRGAVIPQVWFKLAHGATIKIGFAAGFGPKRSHFGRIAFEKEF